MSNYQNSAKIGPYGPGHIFGTSASLRKFRVRMLHWYGENKRRLPWRTARPVPYRVWVSEVMLQQTRVAVVIDYYRRFLRQFPSVRSLAAADEQQVLAAWSGLGYYRRARMMHQAARNIVAQSKGKFPGTSAALRTLPGIGRYTAAAIASICFGEHIAVVDGNVERVISRLLGQSSEGLADLWSAAQALLPAEHPGDFNQAMMELGATICLPKKPVCTECPVKVWCRTRGEWRSSTAIKQKSAELSYLLSLEDNKVGLVQRAQTARRMAGMWELPTIDCRPRKGELISLRHSITDTDYHVKVFAGTSAEECDWIPLESLGQTALTGVTRKILQRLSLMDIKRKTISRNSSLSSRRKKINAST
jgi:A/G-specific adenine glycosylase